MKYKIMYHIILLFCNVLLYTINHTILISKNTYVFLQQALKLSVFFHHLAGF